MPEGTEQQWVKAALACREQMDRWIDQALARHESVPYMGGPDEGEFLSSWFSHYLLTGDERIIQFARQMCDGFRQHAAANFFHGYPPQAEAHHGTENYNYFLLRLWRVDRYAPAGELLVDAAHHVGNWVSEVPAWFDWDSGWFVNWWTGTRQIGGPQTRFEVPDHFRLIQLALAGYHVTAESKYLDLCILWSRRWAEAILQAPLGNPPLEMIPPGSNPDPEELRVASCRHHLTADDPLVEPHVASGTLDALLDLWELTDEEVFRNAARKLCEALIPELGDPAAEPPAGYLMQYRARTGDTSLDERILEALGPLRTPTEGNPLMVIESFGSGPVRGIGKRWDMVRWGYRQMDGSIQPEQAHSCASMALGYALTGEVEWARRALELAALRMKLACQTLRDGRITGCSGDTIHAVAAGNGRCSGYGCMTAAYYPLVAGAIRRFGQEELDERLEPPVPPDVATLMRPAPCTEPAKIYPPRPAASQRE